MRLGIDARMILSSGIGRYLQQLLRELVSHGIDDCVLLGDESALSPHIDPRWRVIPYHTGIYSPKQHLDYPLAPHSVDVMYYPHIHVPFGARVGKKTVLTVHDVFHLSPMATLSLPEKWYMGLYYRNALMKADLVLPNSEFTKSEILRYFPFVQKKDLRVIYPGLACFSSTVPDSCDVIFRILSEYSAKKKLLYVGNVKPHKNLVRLAQAMRSPDLSQCELFIVGKREGFIKGISKAELDAMSSDRIVFTGAVTDTELTFLYAHADLLVFPSLYEGFGYPPLEALSVGTPVVASDIPVIREVCGNAVRYFDPYSPDSIARCVAESLADGNFRERSTVASSSVLARYVPECTARAQAKAIVSLL